MATTKSDSRRGAVGQVVSKENIFIQIIYATLSEGKIKSESAGNVGNDLLSSSHRKTRIIGQS